ncbi:hypothetical protein HPB52_003826 [Rhipicephalus sanguineus]|uniref:Cytochrome P450 n=1 Tax=Rhipicephalus sanguineus TaxID=34632 RepID=A0A9D4Q4H6_RHISA|nr:hypothetical protein HPB52_003826 [Rhipicephalus sanguineus]
MPFLARFVSRKAVNDFEYKGVHYKAGTGFMSPTLHIHRDVRYWPDRLNFNPERFAPENEGSYHKVAYQAFGVGPRNCIGMRMAYMALNLTIARLVQRFHLELGPSQGEHHYKVIGKWLEKYGDTFGREIHPEVPLSTGGLDPESWPEERRQDLGPSQPELIEATYLRVYWEQLKCPGLVGPITFVSGTRHHGHATPAIAAPESPTPSALDSLMMADLKKGADIYLDIAGEHADMGREVNVFELYQRLTMDYVGRAAFGFDYSFQRGPENAFAAATKVILRSAMKGPFHIICRK